jgi:hypothetical protein
MPLVFVFFLKVFLQCQRQLSVNIFDAKIAAVGPRKGAPERAFNFANDIIEASYK